MIDEKTIDEKRASVSILRKDYLPFKIYCVEQDRPVNETLVEAIQVFLEVKKQEKEKELEEDNVI